MTPSTTPALDTAALQAWIETLTDAQVVALTLWGEARGEDERGRRMVASVISNRLAYAKAWRVHFHAAHHWGETARDICLAHCQFSCWSTAQFNAVNLAAMRAVVTRDGALTYAECLGIAGELLGGTLTDCASTATSYINPRDCAPPPWAATANKVAEHGHHVSYRVLDRVLA